ncbi:MAG: HD domain-containing phosphohydrolase [Gammaproteobacteria bacterium]
MQKQQTPLTGEQKEAVRLHPLQSVELLTEAGVKDQEWIKAVLHHHEKLDGSGYLGALRGDDIPLSVRIISLADRYSAMISPRDYRQQMLARDALRDICLQRGAEVDAELAQLFIKELGVYPPGAFVHLQNGEIAIVIKRGAAGNCPTVQSIIGPRGAPLLAPVRRDTSTETYAIREMVTRDKVVNIDMHRLWGYK